MKKRFIYFYFMEKAPEKIKDTIPSHITYWLNLNLEGYAGGPFADQTGGLITFISDDYSNAESFIKNDPFALKGIIKQKWLKEWVVEEMPE